MSMSDLVRCAVLCALTGALLAGCRTPPRHDDVPHGPHPHGDGGFVDLDYNTDPRFFHSTAPGQIGTLYPQGSEVFLVGRGSVGEPTPIFNGAHIYTRASRAQLRFVGGDGRGCVIRTAGVFKGKLTAGTGDCSQQVETKHAAVRAGDRGTVFDVIVSDEFTSVVVAQGTVEVWSGDNPGDRRRLGPRGETRIPFAAEGGPDKGSEHYCRRYADEAVSQNAENVKRKCGFTGAAWQSDFQAHYGWCSTGDNWRSAAPREDKNRQSQLAACDRSREYCRKYADEAVSQNAENIKRKCGFKGAAWQSSYQVHYGWCTTGDNWRKYAPRESSNRLEQLDACRKRVQLY